MIDPYRWPGLDGLRLPKVSPKKTSQAFLGSRLDVMQGELVVSETINTFVTCDESRCADEVSWTCVVVPEV